MPTTVKKTLTIISVYGQVHTILYAPAASACRGHRAFGLFVRAYVRPLSEDQVKIFGQGRISRPIDGSKLIFRMRIYHYETNMNIQET